MPPLSLSLSQQTYTRSDVEQQLNNYFNMLRVSLNTQYTDYVTATVDVAADILEQADGKEVKLDVDAARFTSAHLDTDMQGLENNLIGGKTGSLMPAIGTKGVDPSKKLMDAHEETKRLKEKAAAIQQQFTAMMRDKTHVQNELNAELDVLRAINDIGTTPAEAAIGQLNEEMLALEKDTALAEAEAKGVRRAPRVCARLSQHLFLPPTLAGKIGESTQFQNLKTIIQKKNEEIKGLRERCVHHTMSSFVDGHSVSRLHNTHPHRLTKFEPEGANDDDDE